MTSLDLHPEDLLDKEELTDEERALLDSHLRLCAACRFELQVRADFDRELAGDRETSLHTLVAGAMRAPEAPPRKRVLWTKRAALLAAAALLFVSGIAAAQTGVATRAWQTVGAVFDPPPPATVVNVPPIVVTAPAPVAQPKKASAEPPRIEEPKKEEEPQKVEEPKKEGGPQKVEEPRRIEKRVEAAPPAPPPRLEEPAPPPPPPAPTVEAETASSVFERANAARRHGDVGAAAAAYRDLQSRFPSSSEARLSIALLARMQLDRGDAAGALSGFETYLRTGDGALREEAMAGRALALQRMGRIDEARQAWGDLLRAYPRSSYARFAEKLRQDPG